MGKEATTETKNKKVRIFTIDGNCNVGFLNILGYERLSDYLEKLSSDFITLYNSGSNNITIFIAIKNILRIEEVKEEQSISWSCGPYFWIGFSFSNAILIGIALFIFLEFIIYATYELIFNNPEVPVFIKVFIYCTILVICIDYILTNY